MRNAIIIGLIIIGVVLMVFGFFRTTPNLDVCLVGVLIAAIALFVAFFTQRRQQV